jgi:hypothetical protein
MSKGGTTMQTVEEIHARENARDIKNRETPHGDWLTIGPGLPDPTPEQLIQADELDAREAECHARRLESIDRSGISDGFVSQHCADLTAREHAANARLLRQGGCSFFPALFHLMEDGSVGPRARARLVRGEYGPVWIVLDHEDKAIEWVGDAKRQATFRKRGYFRGVEVAPARARVSGSGTGLGGLATCGIETYRTDGGYPEGATL